MTLGLFDGGQSLGKRTVRRGLGGRRLVQLGLRVRQRGLRIVRLVQLRVRRVLRGLGRRHGGSRVSRVPRSRVERGPGLRFGGVGGGLRGLRGRQRVLGGVEPVLSVGHVLLGRGNLRHVRVICGLRGRQRGLGGRQRGLGPVVGCARLGHGGTGPVGPRLGRIIRGLRLVAGGDGLIEGLLEGRRVGRVRGDPLVELADVIVHVVRLLAGGLRILAELLREGVEVRVLIVGVGAETGVLVGGIHDVEIVADPMEQFGVGAGHLIDVHAGEARIVVRVLQRLLVEGLLVVVPALVGLRAAPCQILARAVVRAHSVMVHVAGLGGEIGLGDGQRHQAVGDLQRLEPLGGAQLVALLDHLQRTTHVLQGDGIVLVARVDVPHVLVDGLVGQDTVGERVAAFEEVYRGLRLLRLRPVQRGLRVRDGLVGSVQRGLRVRLGRVGLRCRVLGLAERGLRVLHVRLRVGHGGLGLVQRGLVRRLRVLGGRQHGLRLIVRVPGRVHVLSGRIHVAGRLRGRALGLIIGGLRVRVREIGLGGVLAGRIQRILRGLGGLGGLLRVGILGGGLGLVVRVLRVLCGLLGLIRGLGGGIGGLLRLVGL